MESDVGGDMVVYYWVRNMLVLRGRSKTKMGLLAARGDSAESRGYSMGDAKIVCISKWVDV